MGTAKIFVATAYVILTKVRTVAIATTADVLIMRSVNGMYVRLIAVMVGVMVMRIVGNVVEIALALVIRDVIILEAVILIVVMVNVTVMKIVSHVMTVAVKKTKNVLLASQC
jgi:hypothetical protein